MTGVAAGEQITLHHPSKPSCLARGKNKPSGMALARRELSEEFSSTSHRLKELAEEEGEGELISPNGKRQAKNSRLLLSQRRVCRCSPSGGRWGSYVLHHRASCPVRWYF